MCLVLATIILSNLRIYNSLLDYSSILPKVKQAINKSLALKVFLCCNLGLQK